MQDLGNDWGNSAPTMRVLVADQEPEMLEAVARAFEVDVATSKATCIDLLRANQFDVLVACERLSDGSGLELLSHVGQRWPHVIRILAIEPERRAMLRGRLGPFKLFETIAYPIDEDKLEAALTRASQAIAENEAAAPTAPPAPRDQAVRNQVAKEQIARPPNASTLPAATPAPSTAERGTSVGGTNIGGSTQRAAAQNAVGQSRVGQGGIGQGGRPSAAPLGTQPLKDARSAGDRTALTPSAPNPRNVPPPSSRQNAQQAAAGKSGNQPVAQGLAPNARKPGAPAPAPEYPPLPSKGSKIVPLGSPGGAEYRIVPHDYHDQTMPGTLRSNRDARAKEPTLHEKAAALAAEAMAAVVRYMKPQSSTRTPAKTPPRKKR
jgi:ActR/RegA family two-component response regulator